MMLEKGCGRLLLITPLMAVTSTGLASELIESSRQTVPLFSKLHETFKSSGVATLSVGPAWESAGNTQTFYLTPNIKKTYAANQISHAFVDGEIFLGIQKSVRKKLKGQLGLAVATTGNASLSGDIWDDTLPQFNNYIYTYQIRHTHIAVKGKLLSDIQLYALKPYVSGSLGVGFNQAHSFSNTPTIFQAIATPNFISNTTTSFTYTAGVGVQKALNTHWQAGVGYEFADWGKSQLGRASGQTVNNGLILNHLYTNGLMFNITWAA